jgi:hypothetical protein
MGLQMRKAVKAAEPVKTCPLLDRPCLKDDCEIYNAKLNRCDISLAAYNLFKFTEVLRATLEAEDKQAA